MRRAGDDSLQLEPRWPIVAALAVAIGLQFALPNRHVLSPTFLFPAVEVLLLLALLFANPGRANAHSARHRIVLALVVLMSIDNAAAVIELIRDIINDAGDDSAEVLLATGGAIYVTNIIAFSLWYWLLDRGGPAERAAGTTTRPSFAFAEMQSPEYVDPKWAPQYVDYLYLAFTNATAFSPTDTLPLTRWAKMVMMAQSAISLVVAVMIIARAVNMLN